MKRQKEALKAVNEQRIVADVGVCKVRDGSEAAITIYCIESIIPTEKGVELWVFCKEQTLFPGFLRSLTNSALFKHSHIINHEYVHFKSLDHH